MTLLKNANGESRVGVHAEKSWDGLVLRSCHTVGEFRQVVALEKEVWGFEDIELVPARLFVVGEKIGGHVLGAYDGSTLVAFAFGLPGVRDGRVYIHSHMLAVKETHRNTGLGREMKLFQREIAMGEGYELDRVDLRPAGDQERLFQPGEAGRGGAAVCGESVWDHLFSAAGRAAERPAGGRVVAALAARGGDAEQREASRYTGGGAGGDSGGDLPVEVAGGDAGAGGRGAAADTGTDCSSASAKDCA